MRTSMHAGSNRESPARRIGEILSILFLATLGTVATMTSLPTRGHAQADTRDVIVSSATQAR